MRNRFVAVLAAVAIAGCGGTTNIALRDLETESILYASLPGADNGRVTDRTGGGSPSVTKLWEVSGDWSAVSVHLAELLVSEGWAVESLNCVGSGNDVIGRKAIDGTWVLVESGAGANGAGIILRLAPQQREPGALTVTGPCPQALVTAAAG